MYYWHVKPVISAMCDAAMFYLFDFDYFDYFRCEASILIKINLMHSSAAVIMHFFFPPFFLFLTYIHEIRITFFTLIIGALIV